MRTVTNEFTVYSVDDVLNMPELRQKVFENYHDFNVSFDEWHDFLLNEWKEKLESYGFCQPEINYSGFWSQGNGASFTCKYIDIPLFFENFTDEIDLTEKQKKLLLALMKDYDLFDFAVKRRSHHYYHEKTVFVNNEDCLYNFSGYNRLYTFLYSAMKKIENVIAEKVIDFSWQIYRELEKEYDYLTSEEAVFESLRCNEYEFIASGKIFY
jgi:hypothetical protein